jgi:hypothetical protein
VVAGGWDRRPHSLGKTCHEKRNSPIWTVSVCFARRPIYNSTGRFASTADSAVGELLSLPLLSVLGVCGLLLRKQLCDCRVWRCYPPIEVAVVGPARRGYGRVDVRNVCKSHARDCHTARRASKTPIVNNLTNCPSAFCAGVDCRSFPPPRRARHAPLVCSLHLSIRGDALYPKPSAPVKQSTEGQTEDNEEPGYDQAYCLA